MGKRIKIICLLICAALCTYTLTACYDNSEIEDLAYVIAIGIDEADSNMFELTFQTAIPKSITGGQGEITDISSFKTDNFLVGFKKTSEYLSRKINLSHAKIIVVSEAIAKKGLLAFLNGLQNNMEIRPDVNIIVAAEGAKKYIESIQPKLSANPAKYYDLLFKSYETDFLVPNVQLGDYLYRVKTYEAQPVTIYTAVDKNVAESEKPAGDSGQSKKIEKKQKTMSIRGLAVFHKDKMVGSLDAREASLYALLTDSSKNITVGITDPLDKRFKILSSIKKESPSNTKIIIKEGKPVIDINLTLSADVQAVQSDNNYNDPEKAAKLKTAYQEYLDGEYKVLLSKAIYEYKSDIFGFGRLAKRGCLTIDDWERVDWEKAFPKADYNLRLDIKLNRQG